jgi:hypothetical protein
MSFMAGGGGSGALSDDNPNQHPMQPPLRATVEALRSE